MTSLNVGWRWRKSNEFVERHCKASFTRTICRRADLLEACLTSIKAASPLTVDAAVITPHRLQALVLVDLLRVTLAAIKRFDQEIAELAPQQPGYKTNNWITMFGASDLYPSILSQAIHSLLGRLSRIVETALH